jgi:hypothetical protein
MRTLVGCVVACLVFAGAASAWVLFKGFRTLSVFRLNLLNRTYCTA